MNEQKFIEYLNEKINVIEELKEYLNKNCNECKVQLKEELPGTISYAYIYGQLLSNEAVLEFILDKEEKSND